VTEFCQVQNSLCVQVVRSPILAALLHGTRAVGISQTLPRGTRNGITELLPRVSPIRGIAAITLGMGIGPHSSFFVGWWVGWSDGLGSKFLDKGLSCSLTDRHEICK